MRGYGPTANFRSVQPSVAEQFGSSKLTSDDRNVSITDVSIGGKWCILSTRLLAVDGPEGQKASWRTGQ
jgi:hypothetical protein